MKNLKYIFFALLLIPMVSCEIDDFPNPNGSSFEEFDEDASKSALQTLVTGVEDLLRKEVGFYYDVTAIIGREYYFFTGSDPRYTGELLGKEASTLDNNGFYGTRPYAGRYRTIKTANLLINGATNSSLITEEELRGYVGFAKTIQAYEYHLVLNLQYENGIRIDVNDPDNLGPFVSYDDALVAINRILDEAKTDLEAAGDEFPFSLSPAMVGFDEPATFLEFNRALAARISLYQGNKTEALDKLDESFIGDMMGDLNEGPARYYSTAGGDFANNLFRAPDQADGIIVHPSFIADATVGDNRLSKVLERPSGTLSLDGLSGDYDVWVYKSLNDYVPLITTEELILIAAEANIGTDNAAAVDAINIIRTAAGIGTYTGDTDDEALLEEVLYQRRYSLFAEGHRWVDLRRLDRLDELPIDRPDDDVWVQFPRPEAEIE